MRERYRTIILPVNSTTTFQADSLGGFACKTGGNITVTSFEGELILDAFPVVAGVYHPLPFFVSQQGGVIVTAGGASGTLGV